MLDGWQLVFLSIVYYDEETGCSEPNKQNKKIIKKHFYAPENAKGIQDPGEFKHFSD